MRCSAASAHHDADDDPLAGNVANVDTVASSLGDGAAATQAWLEGPVEETVSGEAAEGPHPLLMAEKCRCGVHHLDTERFAAVADADWLDSSHLFAPNKMPNFVGGEVPVSALAPPAPRPASIDERDLAEIYYIAAVRYMRSSTTAKKVLWTALFPGEDYKSPEEILSNHGICDFVEDVMCVECGAVYPLPEAPQVCQQYKVALSARIICGVPLFRNRGGNADEDEEEEEADAGSAAGPTKMKRKPLRSIFRLPFPTWLRFWASKRTYEEIKFFLEGWRNRRSPGPDILEDVYDGDVWKSLASEGGALSKPWTIAFGVYVDGLNPNSQNEGRHARTTGPYSMSMFIAA